MQEWNIVLLLRAIEFFTLMALGIVCIVLLVRKVMFTSTEKSDNAVELRLLAICGEDAKFDGQEYRACVDICLEKREAFHNAVKVFAEELVECPDADRNRMLAELAAEDFELFKTVTAEMARLARKPLRLLIDE